MFFMEPAEHKARTRPVNQNSSNSSRAKKRLPKKITETYLHNSGLYYLQRFAASKAHFKSVMMRKVRRSCQHHTDQDLEACKAMVERLAGVFEASGLLNDESYVNGAVASLMRQGRSDKYIRAKLLSKRLSLEQISSALEAYRENDGKTAEDTEIEAALRFIRRKKIGPYRPQELRPEYLRKDLGALARAGFSYDIAQRVLEKDVNSSDA
jgi:regulatory protein